MIIRPGLLYGFECWTFSKDHIKSFHFDLQCGRISINFNTFLSQCRKSTVQTYSLEEFSSTQNQYLHFMKICITNHSHYHHLVLTTKWDDRGHQIFRCQRKGEILGCQYKSLQNLLRFLFICICFVRMKFQSIFCILFERIKIFWKLTSASVVVDVSFFNVKSLPELMMNSELNSD